MKKCALAFKHPIHQRAHRFGDHKHNSKKDQNLRYTDPGHFSTSELLRPKQGIHQVNEQGRRHDSRDGVFHEILLKALRRFRKSPKQNEERDDDSDVENIQQHNHLAKTGWSEADRALESTKMTRWPLD